MHCGHVNDIKNHHIKKYEELKLNKDICGILCQSCCYFYTTVDAGPTNRSQISLSSITIKNLIYINLEILRYSLGSTFILYYTGHILMYMSRLLVGYGLKVADWLAAVY